MTGISIRKMAEKDLEQVVNIEKQVFPDPWSYQAFKSDLENDLAYMIVAEKENAVAGYSCLYILLGEVQLGNFAVAPDTRRQGVARAMMSEIIKVGGERNCDSIFLEVRESNATARQLYLSFGFRVVGRRVGYYRQPNENAVLMVKEL